MGEIRIYGDLIKLSSGNKDKFNEVVSEME